MHTVVVVGTVILAAAAVIGAAALWFSSRDDADDAASTTVPVTTAAPLDTTPTSTEAPRPVVGFDPVCTERDPASTESPTTDEAALDAFGPLGTAPTLAIDLPDSVATGGVTSATASAVRVAGGVVATVTADPAAPFEGAIVARIDLDGTVRWVRCFPTAVTVRAADAATVAGSLAIGTTAGWSDLSLADGSVGDVLAAEPAVAPASPFGDPGTTATWPDPALATIPGEAFTASGTGGMTVVLGCLVAPTATGCDQPVLRGYNAADNALIWERVGVSDVAAVRSGFVLFRYATPGAEPAWYMINAGDGTAVEGQIWPAASFSGTGSLFGGVLTDVTGGVLSVWSPAAAAIPAASVALP